MISKKSRKVVAALLIGATVCASGTFAYFNSKVDLKNVTGATDDSEKTLNITNGTVKIEGKLAGSSPLNTKAYWSYDVAKISTINFINSGSGQQGREANAAQLGITGLTLTSPAASTVLDKNTTYINANKSPDVLQKIGDAIPEHLDLDSNRRTNIGAEVKGTITNTRPGDAFVLGATVNSDGTTLDDQGIEIVNKSSLTTKIGIGLNTQDSTAQAKISKQLESMAAAGWEMYVKVTGTGLANGTPDYSDWTKIDTGSLTSTTFAVATLAPASDVENGTPTGIKVQVRVELPLLSDNKYQEKQFGDGVANGVNAIDITDLFEIVATQENNPGWNQDGTSTRPTTSTANGKDY